MEKDLIEQLKSEKALYAECPSGDIFPLHKAIMFYVDGPVPENVKKIIEEKKKELEEKRLELKKKKKKLQERSEVATRSTNLGKILEKVAPALKGFEFDRKDCRALFEPIDYIVFSGLSTKEGNIDSLYFIDIKTGNSRLNEHQRQIKDAVERGKIDFDNYGGKL